MTEKENVAELEKQRLEKESNDWMRRSEQLQAVLTDSTQRVQDLEENKILLTNKIEALNGRVASIDQYLNHELEAVSCNRMSYSTLTNSSILHSPLSVLDTLPGLRIAPFKTRKFFIGKRAIEKDC